MMILDTNVVSMFMRDPVDDRAVAWLDRQPRSSVWTTSITVLEIRLGLATMAEGRRRSGLMAAFETLLDSVLERRVTPFDNAAAAETARLMAGRQKRGTPRDLRDSMIAGIALARRATLATRNRKHFDDLAIDVVEPIGP